MRPLRFYDRGAADRLHPCVLDPWATAQVDDDCRSVQSRNQIVGLAADTECRISIGQVNSSSQAV